MLLSLSTLPNAPKQTPLVPSRHHRMAQPRLRAIVEFVEGDVNRAPVVYPLGGSDEIDAAMCDAILKRWGAPR